MAKIDPGIIGIRGKIDDKIISKQPDNSSTVRSAPKKGSRTKDPSLAKNHKRTAWLNKLASEINNVGKVYNATFRSRKFYKSLLSRFRDVPLDNRYILLLSVKNLEINPDYPLAAFPRPEMEWEVTKTHFILRLTVTQHPKEYKYNADCYYFQPFLIQWSKEEDRPNVSEQLSDWISSKSSKRPVFTFRFPRIGGLQQWALILRLAMGKNNVALDVKKVEGMQIIEVGTLIKEDINLAKKLEEEKKKKQEKIKKEEPQRVKADKYL
jgi:hypothetical protein